MDSKYGSKEFQKADKSHKGSGDVYTLFPEPRSQAQSQSDFNLWGKEVQESSQEWLQDFLAGHHLLHAANGPTNFYHA
jgi:hypothetical protein